MRSVVGKQYLVVVESDEKTGARLRETWTLDGLRHREHGPAEREWDAKTGNLTLERYFLLGRPCRKDGPSTIEYDPVTQAVSGETWEFYGSLHREGNLPAFWQKDPKTGVVYIEEYWDGGVEHREHGPAIIHRNRNTGAVLKTEHYRNGDLVSAEALTRQEPTLDS